MHAVSHPTTSADQANSADRRIVKVTAHPLRATLPTAQRTAQGNWVAIEIVVVEVETAGGLVGVGECLARSGSRAYAQFIETVLASQLAGEDFLDRRRLWKKMRSVLTGRTGGMLMEAAAGLDIALWDLAGKAANQSISQLLGGMGRAQTPVYASSINWFDDAAVEQEVARAVAAGFKSIKVKIGMPLARAKDRIRFVRRLAGDAIDLSVDANWVYDVHDALSVGAVLVDCGYVWFEEPIKPENRQGYKLLSQQLPIRLAAGESDFSATDALQLIEDRSIGLVQPDVARSGGISETWRIAELAHTFGVAYAPHVGWSGAICLAASLQLAGAAESCITCECMVFDNPLRESMLKHPVGNPEAMLAGNMPIPNGPGLGIEVDRAFLAEYRTP